MKPIIRFTLAALCCSVSAEELIRNGSFEKEAKSFAAKWTASRAYISAGLVTLDRQKARIRMPIPITASTATSAATV